MILVSNLAQGHAKVESVWECFLRRLNVLKASVLGGMIGKLGAPALPLVEVECITDSVNVSVEAAKECPWPMNPAIRTLVMLVALDQGSLFTTFT